MTHSGTTITDLVKLVRKVEGPLCSENGILGYSNEEIDDIDRVSKQFLDGTYPRPACIHDPVGILETCRVCGDRDGFTVANTDSTSEDVLTTNGIEPADEYERRTR